jgi:hypothetical protein
LPIALDQVASFVAQNGAGPDSSGFFRAGEGPQLFALTLDGDVIEVALTDGFSPGIRQIHSTPAWVLFATWGFAAYELVGDEEVEIPCSTIAARRSDDALFCSGSSIRSAGDNWGNVDPGDATVQANAMGDVMYFVSPDDFDQDIVYRVTADDEGLVGTLIEPVWRPNWLAVNAAGDLLVNHLPAGAQASVTEIYPVDSAPPITVTTTSPFIHNLTGVSGSFGAPEEDTFYLLDVGQTPSESSLIVLGKDGDTFAPTVHPLALPMDVACFGLHPLADGIYTFCATALARVVEDGVVLENPVMIPIEGVTSMLPLGIRFGDSEIIVSFTDGTTNMFVRHDGITQQTIPFGDMIELLGYSSSRAGDINFIGVTIDTHEKVIGSVAADSTELQILTSELVDPDTVVSFTRVD